MSNSKTKRQKDEEINGQTPGIEFD